MFQSILHIDNKKGTEEETQQQQPQTCASKKYSMPHLMIMISDLVQAPMF